MTRHSPLPQLARLAAAMRDKALLDLAATAQKKSATEELLRALGDRQIASPSAAMAELAGAELHESWRLQRRALLNQRLARETVQYLDAHQKAATAFGRAAVLDQLAKPK